MSTPIERRLNKLEQAAPPDEDRLDLIILVGMGTEGRRALRASFGEVTANRGTDETDECFIERATAAALAATHQRPCMMFLFHEEAPQ